MDYHQQSVKHCLLKWNLAVTYETSVCSIRDWDASPHCLSLNSIWKQFFDPYSYCKPGPLGFYALYSSFRCHVEIRSFSQLLFLCYEYAVLCNITDLWFPGLEVVSAVLSVALIYILTAVLVYEAVQRTVQQDFDIDGDVMLITAAVGVAVNLM